MVSSMPCPPMLSKRYTIRTSGLRSVFSRNDRMGTPPLERLKIEVFGFETIRSYSDATVQSTGTIDGASGDASDTSSTPERALHPTLSAQRLTTTNAYLHMT